MTKFLAYALVIMTILTLCVGVGYVASNIPCSWYGYSSVKDIPARCLSTFTK